MTRIRPSQFGQSPCRCVRRTSAPKRVRRRVCLTLAFTLIELLVVIAIIAILAVFIAANKKREYDRLVTFCRSVCARRSKPGADSAAASPFWFLLAIVLFFNVGLTRAGVVISEFM